MQTKIITKQEVLAAVEAFKDGKVVALPTETVFGLGVVIDNQKAYEDLINVKNRPSNKAFPVVVGKVEQIFDLAEVDEKQLRVINKYFPGPLTVVLKKKPSVPSYVTASQDTIAIRMSDDPFLLKVLETLDKPILLTSANKSGEKPTVNHHETLNVFNGEIPLIVEGECKYNVASTIVSLVNDEVVLLRQGVINLEEIINTYRRDKMLIAIGSDHGGFVAKQAVVEHLTKRGIGVKNLGCDNQTSCDYPEYGFAVAKEVAAKKADLGIVICSSGVGMSIAANKVKGIRCALAWNPTIAGFARAHNDANMLSLPGKYLSTAEIVAIVDSFLSSTFEGGRHERRVELINKYDKER